MVMNIVGLDEKWTSKYVF